jgi:sortase A
VSNINLNPTQTATITVQLRLNATATVNATINNTVTLNYYYNNQNYTANSTVGFKVTGTSLPGTGGIELEQQPQSVATLPLLLAVGLALAGIFVFFLGLRARDSNPEWAGWISKIGLIVMAAGFAFGLIGWAVSRPTSQATVAMQPQGGPTPEVNLEWLHATEAPWENFPSTSPDELSSLPDYPIPTPTLENPPAAGEPEPDTSPVVRIRIPSIGVDTVVKYVPYDGQSWLISGLRNEVAWMGDTSWPGLGGNTGFAGHVTLGDGSNGPFRGLADLQPGELVIIYTEKNMYTYEVSAATVVEDEDLAVLKPSGKSEITLITCTEWDKDQNTYLKRLIVRSDLLGVDPVANQSRGN